MSFLNRDGYYIDNLFEGRETIKNGYMEIQSPQVRQKPSKARWAAELGRPREEGYQSCHGDREDFRIRNCNLSTAP